MIFTILVLLNVTSCVFQIYFFSHQYLFRGYVAQILTFSLSIIINAMLAINGNPSIALYILLNIFAIYQGFVGIFRLKKIGLDKIQEIREEIEQ